MMAELSATFIFSGNIITLVLFDDVITEDLKSTTKNTESDS